MSLQKLGNELTQLLIVVHKQYGGVALRLGRPIRANFLGEYHINIHG
jgi:hypothetical protein